MIENNFDVGGFGHGDYFGVMGNELFEFEVTGNIEKFGLGKVGFELGDDFLSA